MHYGIIYLEVNEHILTSIVGRRASSWKGRCTKLIIRCAEHVLFISCRFSRELIAIKKNPRHQSYLQRRRTIGGLFTGWASSSESLSWSEHPPATDCRCWIEGKIGGKFIYGSGVNISWPHFRLNRPSRSFPLPTPNFRQAHQQTRSQHSKK